MIPGGISIAAFASGVGLPVGIAKSETNLLLSLATVITQKSFKTFTVKQEKHDAIKLLAQSKLDSIVNIILQAMQDGDILFIEFHKLLEEVEKYRKLKTDIRSQTKAKVKQITNEQREELLEQGRKEGKEDFLQKIANTSGIQSVSATQNLKLLRLTACDFIVPSEFPYCIIHQLLVVHFFIDDLLLLKFIQARHTGGAICTKNNLFVLCDGVFDGFFKLFLCFHAVSAEYI